MIWNRKHENIMRMLMALLAATFLFAVYTVLFQAHLILKYALLWNIFLAASSVPFAMLIGKVSSSVKKPAKYLYEILLGLPWLFLFPNGPYMVTDMIHISLYEFPFGKVEQPEISAWIGMFHIAFSVLLGCLWGNLSLYIMHRAVANQTGEWWGWGFVGTITALTGAGIYIGRFMRFNSWDILHRPVVLLGQVLDTMGKSSVQFVLLFTGAVLLMYVLFYVGFHKTDKKHTSVR